MESRNILDFTTLYLLNIWKYRRDFHKDLRQASSELTRQIRRFENALIRSQSEIMRHSRDFGLGAENRTKETRSAQPFRIFQARMRDRPENRIFIPPENLGTQTSRLRYRVDPQGSTQSDLRPLSQLAEFRTRKNREEEADRSSQDASRDYEAARKTRPSRINRGDRTWLCKFPRKPCKTHRTHSQIRSASRIRVWTPQNRSSGKDHCRTH